jgi:hypothetical protein
MNMSWNLFRHLPRSHVSLINAIKGWLEGILKSAEQHGFIECDSVVSIMTWKIISSIESSNQGFDVCAHNIPKYLKGYTKASGELQKYSELGIEFRRPCLFRETVVISTKSCTTSSTQRWFLSGAALRCKFRNFVTTDYPLEMRGHNSREANSSQITSLRMANKWYVCIEGHRRQQKDNAVPCLCFLTYRAYFRSVAVWTDSVLPWILSRGRSYWSL